MKPTTIVLLTLLALPASAQDARTFHDAAGRVTGSARTDANGVTRFYDAMGRTTGTARTNSNGVTGAQADASGAREHAWLAAAPFFLHLLTHTEDAVFVLDDVHGNPHLIPPLALILFFEGCRELIRMLGRRKG
jgi:YD repeat-containing protein